MVNSDQWLAPGGGDLVSGMYDFGGRGGESRTNLAFKHINSVKVSNEK